MTAPVQLDELGRVVALSAAIFHAEGFWSPGALPRRHRNPGDILGYTGENITYTDVAEGAAAAAHQVLLMLRGLSHVYSLAMTWRRVAQLWTGGDNAGAWCASVCDDLGIAPDSTLGQFANPSLPQVSSPAPAPAQPDSPAQPQP